MSSPRIPPQGLASTPIMIDCFAGSWFFLSNYYPSPVWMDGEIYPSVEHAYQAAKTLDFQIRAVIRGTADPDEAKQLGRAFPHRPNWGEMKIPIMRSLVAEKFQDSALATQLLATGDAELIEGNDWGDKFWGRCGGRGDNVMGRILMEIRTALRPRFQVMVVQVHRVAETALPTDHGNFRIIGYRGPFDGCEHVAVVIGDVQGAQRVLVRVHSECLTGEVFGSRRCDCGPQLQAAMREVASAGLGVVLYLRGHEGRGIGLLAKLRAYQLQDDGHDTVDANLALGLPADARDYRVGAQILADLGIASIRLLSNNPAKRQALIRHGVHVVERVPLITRPTPESAQYMRAKRDRMGHDLPGLPEPVTG